MTDLNDFVMFASEISAAFLPEGTGTTPVDFSSLFSVSSNFASRRPVSKFNRTWSPGGIFWPSRIIFHSLVGIKSSSVSSHETTDKITIKTHKIFILVSIDSNFSKAHFIPFRIMIQDDVTLTRTNQVVTSTQVATFHFLWNEIVSRTKYRIVFHHHPKFYRISVSNRRFCTIGWYSWISFI